MFIVDSHTYVISDDDSNYPKIAQPADWVSHAVTTEALVANMEAAGVAKATLIQALQAHGYDNSYTIDSANHFPDRFVAIGMYDFADEATATKLLYEATQRGIQGARITPRALLSDTAIASWKVANELRLPIVIAAASPGSFGEIRAAAEQFSDTPILLEGLGLTNEVYEGPPFTKQAPLFSLKRYANIYLKWCTDQLIDMPKLEWQQMFIQRLVTDFGAERVMWGSRYPYRHERAWTYQSQVDAAIKVVEPLSAKSMQLVMGGAAAELWPQLRI